jgi:hypothetical protein
LLYGAAKSKGHKKQITESIKGAYAVTVTHDLLAKTIMAELGQQNVYVCPNQILPEGQFELKPTSLDKITFGWSGSITHFEDVLMLHDSLLNLYKNDNRFKMVYGGYDGTDHTSSAIAGVLSCKGTAPKDQFEIFPAKDVLEYANFYDFIDIALIPLRNNRFNNMKSNLKLTFGYELFLRLTHNSAKIMTIPRIGYKHMNLREGSIFWNYKNGEEKMDQKEAKFWIDSAKKEYFFTTERDIKYVPEEI